MSFVVYTRNKNGSTYAYEVTSFRDPSTKKNRQKRIYLGKYDEETQRIIPKKEREPVSHKESDANKNSNASDKEGNETGLPVNYIQQVNQTIDSLEKEKQVLAKAFEQLSKIAGDLSTELSSIEFNKL